MKHAWTSKDGNVNRLSVVHSMEGLSPFTMLYMDEDKVAIMNNEEDLVTSSSVVSVADLWSQKRKVRICVLQEAEEIWTHDETLRKFDLRCILIDLTTI